MVCEKQEADGKIEEQKQQMSLSPWRQAK